MTLQQIIDTYNNIVFFGGAGVSTESGIPDFRSESGIYKTIKTYGYSPEKILSRSFFFSHPDIFYRFYKETILHLNARPNNAHIALAALEAKGKLRTIVTQNIDGLHQCAGSKHVIELHGSIQNNFCRSCKKAHTLADIIKAENVPRCKQCNSIIKPDVVLYEENLKSSNIKRAIKAISEAEVLIIGGTSLIVYPAASFIEYFEGEQLVLINLSETAKDTEADLLIQGAIGQVLGGLKI